MSITETSVPDALAILDHYHAVLDTEIAAIDSSAELITDHLVSAQPVSGQTLGALNRITTARNATSTRFAASDTTGPRPSHALLQAAYRDMWANNAIKVDNSGMFRLVSEQLLPLADPSQRNNLVEGNLSRNDGHQCEEAETYFTRAIGQIAGTLASGQSRLSVYYNQAREPILLRKKVESSTALTLQPIAHQDQLLAPAGTIVAVDENMGINIGGSVRVADDVVFTSYEVKKPFCITPLRLSPWAYDDPIDRALFAIQPSKADGTEVVKFDSRRAKLTSEHTLEDFTQAAVRLMEICGVEAAA